MGAVPRAHCNASIVVVRHFCEINLLLYWSNLELCVGGMNTHGTMRHVARQRGSSWGSP